MSRFEIVDCGANGEADISPETTNSFQNSNNDNNEETFEELWEAQAKQAKALACPFDELFYGGAKYGGKSDFLLIDFWQQQEQHGKAAKGILFRRSYNELEELIYRSREIYLDAHFKETSKTWEWPNGAILKMRFIEADADVGRYQGHQYSWIGFDELTEWPTSYCYIFMFSCLRSPAGIPCYMRATGNPGRIGHQWVKARFVDPASPLTPITEQLGDRTMRRVFIPATLDDNIIGIKADPQYEARLKLLPPYLYEAFRHGNWDVISGAAFPDLRRDIHMLDVFDPPERLQRIFDFEAMTPKENIHIFRSLDWGYAKPFSVGWYFSDYDNRIYRYREMYGCSSNNNEGIQLPARDVAMRIKAIETEHNEHISLSIADASIWDKPSNQSERAEKLPSIAETFAEEGIYFDRSISIDAKRSRIQGKHQLHERLRLDADGLPNFQVFSNCIHWWRTVPVLPIDRLNPEDVDTNAEDHCYDETRYMLSARPFKSHIPKKEEEPWTFAWYEKRLEEKEERAVSTRRHYAR